jgi:hypothetical protein
MHQDRLEKVADLYTQGFISHSEMIRYLGLPTREEMEKEMAMSLQQLPLTSPGSSINPLSGAHAPRKSPSDEAPDFAVSVVGDMCDLAKNEDLSNKLIDEVTLLILRALEDRPKILLTFAQQQLYGGDYSNESNFASTVQKILVRELQTNLRVTKVAFQQEIELRPKIRVHLAIALDQEFIDRYSDDCYISSLIEDLDNPVEDQRIAIVDLVTYETKIVKSWADQAKAEYEEFSKNSYGSKLRDYSTYDGEDYD